MATLAVVGLGLMGMSFAQALKRTRPDLVLVGSDPDEHALRRALDRGVVTTASRGLDVVEVADVVVLAAPIPAMRGVLMQLGGRTAGKTVTDMASTKTAVMGWAEESGVDLVGGHPMCGKESSGGAAADPEMFRGAPWVLTRADPVVVGLVTAVGAHPLVLDASTHDRLVAGVSHAAFLVSAAYVLALARRADWPEAAQLAAGGFRDMSRLAAGDPELYSAIAHTNRERLLEAVDAIIAELTRLRRHIEADDPRLVELFEEARSIRRRWSGD